MADGNGNGHRRRSGLPPPAPAAGGAISRARFYQLDEAGQLPAGLEPPVEGAPLPPAPQGVRVYSRRGADPVIPEVIYAGTMPDPDVPGGRKHLWLALAPAGTSISPSGRVECDLLPVGTALGFLLDTASWRDG